MAKRSVAQRKGERFPDAHHAHPVFRKVALRRALSALS